MRARDHRDGIDLHVTELLDGAMHGLFAAAESLGLQQALPVEREDRGSLLLGYEYLPAAGWSIQAQLVAGTSALPDNPQLENSPCAL